MSKGHLLVLWSSDTRRRAIDMIRSAPKDTRVTFQGPRRSLPQNAKMWAMLQEISERIEHCGRKYQPETWKALFLSAWGLEVQFVPSLNGGGMIPVMYRTSDLTKEEMASLIDFIEAWAAENDFQFSGPDRDDPPPPASLEDYRS